MASDHNQQVMEALAQLTEEVCGLRTEVTDEVSGLRTEVTDAIGELRTEVTEEVSGLRTEVKQTSERLDQTNARLDTSIAWHQQTNHVIGRLEQEVAVMNRRFDHFLLGPHRNDHDDLRRRVERLEDVVGIDEP